MKLSWIPAAGLVLIGTLGAWALDAPRTLHHARSAEPRLTEPHRAASHRSTAHAAERSAPAHEQARLTPRGKARASVRRVAMISRRHHHSYERFTASSFAKGDIFAGDITAGEDPVVRQAAIDAMGDMNGTAVVIDPSNGRILAMVNQKLALSPGAEPCSTIKITVAMAALSEGLVTRDTPVQLGGFHMNMTDALAKSNNLYFEELGRELGFERVRYYANQFGLGELAGYHIDGEQLGVYPDKELPASEGGVARMCSFGQGVSLTPLQLGAYVAALANGGTLYYLQHPTTPEEAAALEPKIKRTLDIAKYVPDSAGRHGRRGRVRHRPQPARQLPRAAGLRQDRNLLGKGNPLRLVRLLLRLAAGQPGYRLLPRRRPGHLRAPRGGTDRRLLQESLGPQLVCRPKASRKPPPRLRPPLSRISRRMAFFRACPAETANP